MNKDCDVFQPLNTKLLAKREETERLIRNEYLKLKTLLLDKQKYHTKLTSTVQSLQEESNELLNKTSLLGGKISTIKLNITKVQDSVQDIMFKIDGLMLKKMFANMVQEKEVKTLQLFYKKMDEQKQLLKEFWEKGLEDSEILEMENKKNKLVEKQEVLQDQINWFNERCSESKITKLTEECMILRKRNAAMLRRKTKILEQLEKKVLEKKEEIARARRNMIFKSS
ncbi:unnamed protein product [Nezara viridula]|uniref:Uncharacterized protein n=1 Tax=Nezara viridula TaxID=85310 RepID=A0A9P0HJE8_NEZVI|nr:unnamed protein product [Nezara viridula]